ncbi:hypothetical protein [Acidimangrovimonas sediminis]|uniref:hypothetical protein n=1 Tax=Acidimangrovimonas sediminis TaxID=2056283 RepID=UPI0011AF5762|nr:hypothetical protein [Acidimangrovimonas sediminis]
MAFSALAAFLSRPQADAQIGASFFMRLPPAEHRGKPILTGPPSAISITGPPAGAAARRPSGRGKAIRGHVVDRILGRALDAGNRVFRGCGLLARGQCQDAEKHRQYGKHSHDMSLSSDTRLLLRA